MKALDPGVAKVHDGRSKVAEAFVFGYERVLGGLGIKMSLLQVLYTLWPMVLICHIRGVHREVSTCTLQEQVEKYAHALHGVFFVCGQPLLYRGLCIFFVLEEIA